MNETPADLRDPLREATASGGFSRGDIDDVFAAWMGSLFMDDRWARLDQAQMPDAQKTRLAAVFVDLDVSTTQPVSASAVQGSTAFVRSWLLGGMARTLTVSETWRR